MSDIYAILTDDNQPVVVFSNEADAQRYVEVQSRGSALMPARSDLRVMRYTVWRSFDKIRAMTQKIDASWGVDEPAAPVKAGA